MTKTKQTKKLALSIDTLRRLDDARLSAVAGGAVLSYPQPCAKGDAAQCGSASSSSA